MGRPKINKCIIDSCDEPVMAKGLCATCYAWDYYHIQNRHGIGYMVKYQKKLNRIGARVDARVRMQGVRSIVKRRRHG